MVEALRADPETAAWCAEKGDASRERELHRIWSKAADDTPPWLEQMNRDWAVIRVGGKVVVMTEESDVLLGFDRVTQPFLRAADFRLLLANQRISTRDAKGRVAEVPIADAWLVHPSRRTYSGLGMYPPPLAIPIGHYNLWRGWGIQPASGDWPLLYNHFQRVLSGGDQASCDYLLYWIAYGLQHPAEKMDVSVLLIGGQGGGKGALGNLLTRVYGNHGIYLNKKEQFVGKHNAHLAGALFAYIDEAFFGGDRASAGAVKSLISEPTLPIEPKFVDLFHVPNRLRLLFSSNERHALHLDVDDRRVATFETAPAWEDEAARLYI